MKITLSPVASNKTTQVSVTGSVITVDGVEHDLSAIPVGGQADPEVGSPFIGVVTHDEITICYEYDSSKAEPNQSTDPVAYQVIDPVGEIPSPIKWRA